MPTRAVAFLASARHADAKAFYEGTLGLPLIEDSPFAFVFAVYGTPLRVQKVEAVVVAPYTAFGFDVPDLEAAIDALVAKGVEMKRYPWFEQDPRGIWTAPGGARVAWFHDPDGNLLSVSAG